MNSIEWIKFSHSLLSFLIIIYLLLAGTFLSQIKYSTKKTVGYYSYPIIDYTISSQNYHFMKGSWVAYGLHEYKYYFFF